MSTKPITIGIAGKGKVTFAHLSSLLDDWLDVTKDGDVDRETTWVLPVADRTEGDTEDAVMRYLDELRLPYIAVSDGTEARPQRKILRDAEAVDEVDESEEAEYLANGVITRLVSAKQAGEEAVLLLAWGDKDPNDDELTERLLDDAVQNEITVLDLTHGLDDIGFKNEPEDDPDEEDDPEPPAKTTRRKTTKAAAKPAEDAASTLAEAIADKVTDVIPLLTRARKALSRANEVYDALAALRALAGTEKYNEDSTEVLELLSDIDGLEADLAATMMTDTPEPDAEPEEAKPARRRVANPAPAEETPAKPATRGKPRTAKKPAGETVKVIEKPDGSYNKLGRGRPPATGTETRGGVVVEITREAFERLDFS